MAAIAEGKFYLHCGQTQCPSFSSLGSGYVKDKNKESTPILSKGNDLACMVFVLLQNPIFKVNFCFFFLEFLPYKSRFLPG